jgi:hypothetical protein
MLLQFQLYFEESFAVAHITAGELRVTTSRFVDAVTELAAAGTSRVAHSSAVVVRPFVVTVTPACVVCNRFSLQ